MMPISGIRKIIAARSTSPAKMFPNRRKVKLTTLATSEISSSIPTKKPMAPSLKFMNLPMCPNTPKLAESPEVDHHHRYDGDCERSIQVGVGAPEPRHQYSRLLALFFGFGKLLPLLDADVTTNRPWRQIAEGSLTFEDLHLFVRETVVVLGRIVKVAVTVVVGNLFVGLNATYRAKARKYADPVGDEYEQEDAHHQWEEPSGAFASGDGLSKVEEELEDYFDEALESPGHI